MYRITFALSGPHVGRVGCVQLRMPQKWLGCSLLPTVSICLFKVLMFDKQMFI